MKEDRLSKIKKLLKIESFDALLVSSVPNIIYLTGYNGFSTNEREAYLFIAKNKQYIVTDGRYTEVVYKKVPHFTLIERSTTVSFKQIFQDLAIKHTIKKLGIEEDDITVAEHKTLKSCFNVLKHFNTQEFRIIKHPEEIDRIQKACKIGDKAFQYVLKKLKPGITEKQIAFELESFIKQQDADVSFKTIVAFGSNSSLPHHVTGNQKLKTNTIVLMDFGVKVYNYCSDITRTIFFGKADQKFKKIYQTVYDAQQKAAEYIYSAVSRNTVTRDLHGISPSPSASRNDNKNGVKASTVDKIARDYITSNGFPSIPHSLGHGIGIEVHEAPTLAPNSKDELKPGMVFSIEPGIYIPGFGGIRIEDLVMLENKTVRLLTSTPKNLIEL